MRAAVVREFGKRHREASGSTGMVPHDPCMDFTGGAPLAFIRSCRRPLRNPGPGHNPSPPAGAELGQLAPLPVRPSAQKPHSAGLSCASRAPGGLRVRQARRRLQAALIVLVPMRPSGQKPRQCSPPAARLARHARPTWTWIERPAQRGRPNGERAAARPRISPEGPVRVERIRLRARARQ